MQTLDTPTLALCYAAADRETARAVADFLCRGSDVKIDCEDGEMAVGGDLAEKVRQALSADIIVVLFSRDSLPPRWRRDQWEDALVNEPQAGDVRIGFFKCDDCVPPRVLKPIFERNQIRQLKRWVRNRAASFEPPDDIRLPGASLEELGIALADRPGGIEYVEDTARAFEFVRAYREDFDEVFVIECGRRTLAALAGDLASQLRLPLGGELEENLDHIREFCEKRRFLIILDGVTREPFEELVFGGRCSTLVSSGKWEGRVPDELCQAQHALTTLSGSWEEICRHARTGRRITRDQGRLAECYELMQQWHAAADERGDREVLDESAREIVWILEGWGRMDEARTIDYRRATEYDQQLMFPFGLNG